MEENPSDKGKKTNVEKKNRKTRKIKTDQKKSAEPDTSTKKKILTKTTTRLYQSSSSSSNTETQQGGGMDDNNNEPKPTQEKFPLPEIPYLTKTLQW